MARQPLGRGLNAILGDADAPPPVAAVPKPAESGDEAGRLGVTEVPIERVVAGRAQPRRTFDEDALDELAQSIREQGILQPLVVVRGSGGYELIAGERRLRAAQRAGLERVPIVVRESAPEPELVEMALVENVQREDLSPLERARAYLRLTEAHGYTQEQLAQRVGKSRVAIANTLRLLALPDAIRQALDDGHISEGHARALLALRTAAEQISALRQIMKRSLSVRQAEELVRDHGPSGEPSSKPKKLKSGSTKLEQSLSRSLGTRVRLRGRAKRGRIEIDYHSKDELDRLIHLLEGANHS